MYILNYFVTGQNVWILCKFLVTFPPFKQGTIDIFGQLGGLNACLDNKIKKKTTNLRRFIDQYEKDYD